MFEPKNALDVCQKYLTHYGKHYTKNSGKEPTYEVLARIWNGGPNGWRRSSTDEYWKGVQRFL